MKFARVVLQFGGIMILLGIMIGYAPISAASVIIEPKTIAPDEPITVAIDEITERSTVEIAIDAAIVTKPNETFNFSVRDLTFDYDLDPAELRAAVTGLSDDDPCKLYIKEPDMPFIPGGEVTRKGYPTNGTFEVYALQAIEPLPYQTFFTGTSADPEVHVKMNMKGTKTTGSDTARTTFKLHGLSQGSCTIDVLMNGTLIKSENVSIKSES